MSIRFETPQDAEDALYDALEAADLDSLMTVWEDSEQIACLLPMTPLLQGREAVREGWRRLVASEVTPEINIHHRDWIETGDLAIHLLEERVVIPDSQQPPIQIFASNVYRRTPNGWRLVIHQASPLPPPPGMAPPGGPPMPNIGS